MFKNYLKTALRHLGKQRGYAFINIAGLSVGIACALLIWLFVRSEWSYDRFHAQADQIHRAWVLEDYGDNQRFHNTITPIPLGPALADAFPEIEQVVRLMRRQNQVSRGEVRFAESLHLADDGFFEMFDFPLRRGDPATALAEPDGVVLTETAAVRYFADEEPLGKTLTIDLGNGPRDFTVTGVAADPPEASSIQFQMVLPFALTDELVSERARQSWFNVSVETYVLLPPGTPATALDDKMPAFVTQILADRVSEGQYTVGLQPLTDIHLNPAMPAGFSAVSDPAYGYILAGIALLVLLIACINFVTLSLGRSAGRAMEVGVRKVVGAGRQQLMAQFWGEALLVTALALLLGGVLADAALPSFNALAGRNLTLGFDASTLGFLFTLFLVIGLLAGIYPAVFLSGFRPIEVLKGTFRMRGDQSFLRRGLVVFQFALSIFLIAGTLIMARQLDYLRSKNLGFDKEQLVVIPTGLPMEDGMALAERFRNEVAARPEVAGLGASAFTFGQGSWIFVGFDAGDGTYRDFRFNMVDADYLPTLGIEVVAGRAFSRAIPSDATRAVMVNEAFVAEYGWDAPLSQRLPGGFDDHEIIGVVRDFNFASLHAPVEPLVLAMNRQTVFSGAGDVSFPGSSAPKLAVRLRADDLPAALAMLEATWQRVAPDQPFDFSFVDETLDAQYRQEERMSTMVGWATLLAIFIACLGLFGLAALAAVRRTKEIGIRKVLGASTGSIVVLLSKDLTWLVGIAFVVAAPAAYLAARRWLADFAFRIDLGVDLFLLAGLLAVLVAWGAVSLQSFRAARANPVQSLRSE